MVMLQLKKRSGAATGFLAIVAAAAVLTPRGFFGAHALSDTDYWKLINGEAPTKWWRRGGLIDAASVCCTPNSDKATL